MSDTELSSSRVRLANYDIQIGNDEYLLWNHKHIEDYLLYFEYKCCRRELHVVLNLV